MSMSLPPPTGPPRCPSCGALTPAGSVGRAAQWCSLCHAPLHEAVASVPANDAAEGQHVPPPNEQTPAESTDLVGGDLDEGLVEQMLVELRASDDDPWVRRSSSMTRGRQVALGVAVALGIILLILVITVVVGFLLR